MLLVIYPYKFHDFVYDLLELGFFQPYCDVQVLDVSPVTSPRFAKAISAARSSREGVTAVMSLRQFIRSALHVRKRAMDARVCVINEVINNSLPAFLCNLVTTLLLRGRNVAVIDLYNGGLPLRYPDERGQSRVAAYELSLWAKVARLAKEASALSEVKKRMTSVLLSRLSRLLPSATTHRLVAGEDWLALAQAKGHARGGIQLVCGHSHDYSDSIRHGRKSFTRMNCRFAVFLDGAAPMYGSDAAVLGRKVYFTADVWYPALCRFFDRLEAETGVRVEIAGHYKTTYPPVSPIFGNRRVHYGKTAELVRDSEFVITRASTATSYAVAFRKPVIFIYSNQLVADITAMTHGRGMAAMLGKELINIDEAEAKLDRHLTVDEEKYLQYERACLTSDTSRRPNFEIMLNDIMNIETESDVVSDRVKASA